MVSFIYFTYSTNKTEVNAKKNLISSSAWIIHFVK